MPGRKPYEAFEAFVGPLTDALSCVANFRPTTSPGGKQTVGGTPHTLYLTGLANDGYLRLAGAGAKRLEFFARISYEIIVREPPVPSAPYRITTRGYMYSLRLVDGSAVLDYHWHPLSSSCEKRPHLHIGSTQLRSDSVLTNKMHVQTGRITFESVIRDAISMGATPLCEDWDKRLELAEAPHREHRTWG